MFNEYEEKGLINMNKKYQKWKKRVSKLKKAPKTI